LHQNVLDQAREKIQRGETLANSFLSAERLYPPLVGEMIAVGEETGQMEEVLAKVSHIFEVESDQKVKGLTSAVEPLVMIFLGLGVGFLVIAIILPIYNLTSQF